MFDKLASITMPASIAVAQKAKALRQAGIDVIDLSIGQPDLLPQLSSQQLLQIWQMPGVHGYSASQGILPLRESIASSAAVKYRVPLDAANIIVTPGAKLGLHYLFDMLSKPASNVVIVQPSWLSYTELAQWSGHQVRIVSGRKAQRFLPSVSEVLASVDDNTVAVVVNSPVNPVGVFWPKQDLADLYQQLAEQNGYLILDAIYDDFDYQDLKPTFETWQADAAWPERLILVHGFSKIHCLAGHRLGYIVSTSGVCEQLNLVQANLMTCPATMTQHLGLASLAQGSKTTEAVALQYQGRRDYVQQRLRDAALSFIEADGTFYLLLDTQRLANNSVSACHRLLEEAKIAAVPGVAYGNSAEHTMRWSLVEPIERLALACDRFIALCQSR